MPEPTLNQRSKLLEILIKILPPEYYTGFEDGRLFRFTGTLTEKQYKRMLALYYNRKNDEIKADVDKYFTNLT